MLDDTEPIILHIDSMDGGPHNASTIFTQLRSYLHYEWLHQASLGEGNANRAKSWRAEHNGCDPQFLNKKADGRANKRSSKQSSNNAIPLEQDASSSIQQSSMPAVHTCKLKYLPTQDNYCDCGLFMLSSIQFFCHANPHRLDYSVVQSLNYPRKPECENGKAILQQACRHGHVGFLTPQWFHPENANLLREHIRYLIHYHLFETALEAHKAKTLVMSTGDRAASISDESNPRRHSAPSTLGMPLMSKPSTAEGHGIVLKQDKMEAEDQMGGRKVGGSEGMVMDSEHQQTVGSDEVLTAEAEGHEEDGQDHKQQGSRNPCGKEGGRSLVKARDDDDVAVDTTSPSGQESQGGGRYMVISNREVLPRLPGRLLELKGLIDAYEAIPHMARKRFLEPEEYMQHRDTYLNLQRIASAADDDIFSPEEVGQHAGTSNNHCKRQRKNHATAAAEEASSPSGSCIVVLPTRASSRLQTTQQLQAAATNRPTTLSKRVISRHGSLVSDDNEAAVPKKSTRDEQDLKSSKGYDEEDLISTRASLLSSLRKDNELIKFGESQHTVAAMMSESLEDEDLDLPLPDSQLVQGPALYRTSKGAQVASAMTASHDRSSDAQLVSPALHDEKKLPPEVWSSRSTPLKDDIGGADYAYGLDDDLGCVSAAAAAAAAEVVSPSNNGRYDNKRRLGRCGGCSEGGDKFHMVAAVGRNANEQTGDLIINRSHQLSAQEEEDFDQGYGDHLDVEEKRSALHGWEDDDSLLQQQGQQQQQQQEKRSALHGWEDDDSLLQQQGQRPMMTTGAMLQAIPRLVPSAASSEHYNRQQQDSSDVQVISCRPYVLLDAAADASNAGGGALKGRRTNSTLPFVMTEASTSADNKPGSKKIAELQRYQYCHNRAGGMASSDIRICTDKSGFQRTSGAAGWPSSTGVAAAAACRHNADGEGEGGGRPNSHIRWGGDFDVELDRSVSDKEARDDDGDQEEPSARIPLLPSGPLPASRDDGPLNGSAITEGSDTPSHQFHVRNKTSSRASPARPSCHTQQQTSTATTRVETTSVGIVVPAAASPSSHYFNDRSTHQTACGSRHSDQSAANQEGTKRSKLSSGQLGRSHRGQQSGSRALAGALSNDDDQQAAEASPLSTPHDLDLKLTSSSTDDEQQLQEGRPALVDVDCLGSPSEAHDDYAGRIIMDTGSALAGASVSCEVAAEEEEQDNADTPSISVPGLPASSAAAAASSCHAMRSATDVVLTGTNRLKKQRLASSSAPPIQPVTFVPSASAEPSTSSPAYKIHTSSSVHSDSGAWQLPLLDAPAAAVASSRTKGDIVLMEDVVRKQVNAIDKKEEALALKKVLTDVMKHSTYIHMEAAVSLSKTSKPQTTAPAGATTTATARQLAVCTTGLAEEASAPAEVQLAAAAVLHRPPSPKAIIPVVPTSSPDVNQKAGKPQQQTSLAQGQLQKPLLQSPDDVINLTNDDDGDDDGNCHRGDDRYGNYAAGSHQGGNNQASGAASRPRADTGQLGLTHYKQGLPHDKDFVKTADPSSSSENKAKEEDDYSKDESNASSKKREGGEKKGHSSRKNKRKRDNRRHNRSR
ncbi:hypothetical protein CEUSTIGMA_g5421.t1 [Chlamydomonas eustigma]|uniref:Ubiquitin-like protease family profile domain-containing protein n=1 Tax=Chlamydomonas eustigma TaxID=1157962 RepID=A0A250X4Y5_9CHLO|nr:hypothetical protein CEUSTIGMA_g5421.t1 [Chlamydomonas eustigma]|eukprot:GAX77979.1 hypothetical protein CEUSTIGMA_g5421.t1 [Chlamydomonas eustigma]